MTTSDEGLRVVAAAILHQGRVWSVDPPGRHHDVMLHMLAHGVTTDSTSEQGFLLSNGEFCMRKAACLVAERAGQIRQKTHPENVLFSEDLW